jgi:hypothetical protein
MEPEARPAGGARAGNSPTGGGGRSAPVTAAQKEAVRRALAEYLQPYLRA